MTKLERMPLPPFQFLAATAAILIAFEKIVFPSAPAFELPPQLARLSQFIEFLPGGALLLIVGGILCFALVPYALLRLLGKPIPLRVVLRAYAYQQAILLLPLVLTVYVPLAVIPTLGLSFAQTAAWATAPIGIYSFYWMSRQLKYEGYSGAGAIWVGLLVPGFLVVAVKDFGGWPVRSFNLSSGSMKPTLLLGDVVVANQWAFRWRDPYPGELLAVRLPRDPDTVYIKRLIGLPGDRVQMRDGVVHLNGAPVTLERLSDFVDVEDGQKNKIKRFRETLPNGASYEVLDTIEGLLDSTEEYVVPDDHYFLLGDHRDNSTDSRIMSAFGYIPVSNLVGPIYRRILPANRPLKIATPN